MGIGRRRVTQRHRRFLRLRQCGQPVAVPHRPRRKRGNLSLFAASAARRERINPYGGMTEFQNPLRHVERIRIFARMTRRTRVFGHQLRLRFHERADRLHHGKRERIVSRRDRSERHRKNRHGLHSVPLQFFDLRHYRNLYLQLGSHRRIGAERTKKPTVSGRFSYPRNLELSADRAFDPLVRRVVRRVGSSPKVRSYRVRSSGSPMPIPGCIEIVCVDADRNAFARGMGVVLAHLVPGIDRRPSGGAIGRTVHFDRRGFDVEFRTAYVAFGGNPRRHAGGIARSHGIEEVAVGRARSGSSRIARLDADWLGSTVVRIVRAERPSRVQKRGIGGRASDAPTRNGASARSGKRGCHSGIEIVDVGDHGVPSARGERIARNRRGHRGVPCGERGSGARQNRQCPYREERPVGKRFADFHKLMDF